MIGVERIGRYEVLNHLASGGMGQVYLARSTGLGGFERQVVVKTLDASITDDDGEFVTMFLDEARLVGALHHQYIASIYEVGLDEDGRYFLVMDYVHGETAEAMFRVSNERGQVLPLAFTLTVASCVASALDYAHSLCAADGTPLDIVHRDISLSNVMCGHDGAVKLIDFGIAKAANRATRTQVGTLKGKIGYLAPEQILRGPVDHRADIFALGIVIYEMTTGQRAFRDNSDLITLERITSGELRRPSELVPGYPAELERIVMKALQVDQHLRYQDAGSLGRALETYAVAAGIPLGHAAIVESMSRLFGDRRVRRRMARGSNDVQSDPAVVALAPTVDRHGDDEKTPITDVVETHVLTLESETITRNVAQPAIARSQRPTTPLIGRQVAAVPLEDLPTPFADPALAMRAANALIPFEDRPTPFADPPMSFQLPLAPPDRPTPPQRPGAPGRPDRIPTGPQLPVVDEDATEIAAIPTPAPALGHMPLPPPPPTHDSGLHVVGVSRPPQAYRTGTALVALPPKQRVDQATRTWLMLCGLFAIAVTVAIIVAML